MAILQDTAWDRTFDFWRRGYVFFSELGREIGSDAYWTRLGLSRVLCMKGADAARFFYEDAPMTRKGAVPISVVKLLQDFGSVQELSGLAHRHRKELFLRLFTGEAAHKLAEVFENAWREDAEAWRRQDSIIFFDAVRRVLTCTVCRWAGVDLPPSDVDRRTRQLSEIIEATGSIGPRMWRAQVYRSLLEKWARAEIRRARAEADTSTPLGQVASHRELDGNLLSENDAAVELLNVLRPVVAVGRFLVFAAMALHEHPEMRLTVTNDVKFRRMFALEVRRTTPFFPVIGGRLTAPSRWHGEELPEGAWILFDIYGTNNDPQLWEAPERFEPLRYKNEGTSLYNFVPQGAGDRSRTHRCPGEDATGLIIETTSRLLAANSDNDLPEQDLSVDLGNIPAAPASGLVIQFRDNTERRQSF